MTKPIYEQIYQAIKKDILDGRYKEGDRLPSEKELCEEWGVSKITPKKSLEKLRQEGLIIRQAGRGSFVAKTSSKPQYVSSPAGFTNQRYSLIGLVMHGFADDYGRELLHSIEKNAPELCFIILRFSHGDVEQEQRAIQELLKIGVDGIIISPAQADHYSTDILRLVIDEFPLILVDRFFRGVAASSVATDNIKASIKGVNYLFELNHRHICLLTPPPIATTAIQDRIEGFIQAHAERGVVANRDLIMSDITCFSNPTDQNIQEDIEKIKRIITKTPNLKAFLATEYPIAQLAKLAVEQLGLSVPDDFSILCFDSPRLQLDGTRFTHIRQNEELMGKIAIETVMKLRSGELQRKRNILLDAEVVDGETTASPRESKVLKRS